MTRWVTHFATAAVLLLTVVPASSGWHEGGAPLDRCALHNLANCGEVHADGPTTTCVPAANGAIACETECTGHAVGSNWIGDWHAGLQLECGFFNTDRHWIENPCVFIFSTNSQLLPAARFDLECNDEHNSIGGGSHVNIPAGECRTPMTILWSVYWSGLVYAFTDNAAWRVGTLRHVVTASEVCA